MELFRRSKGPNCSNEVYGYYFVHNGKEYPVDFGVFRNNFCRKIEYDITFNDGKETKTLVMADDMTADAMSKICHNFARIFNDIFAKDYGEVEFFFKTQRIPEENILAEKIPHDISIEK